MVACPYNNVPYYTQVHRSDDFMLIFVLNIDQSIEILLQKLLTTLLKPHILMQVQIRNDYNIYIP